MTRKHFIAIASSIKEITNDEERSRIARLLASTLAGTNAQFDRSRFLTACNAQ